MSQSKYPFQQLSSFIHPIILTSDQKLKSDKDALSDFIKPLKTMTNFDGCFTEVPCQEVPNAFFELKL